jgi:hypothetical protein
METPANHAVSAATPIPDPAGFFLSPTKPLISPDIIRAWTSKGYLVGERPSDGYEYIGYSLALCGIYKYATFAWVPNAKKTGNDKVMTHFGYCMISLEDGQLRYGGVRLWTSHDKRVWKSKDGIKEICHPVYWQSVISKYSRLAGRRRMHFGYVIYPYNEKTYNAVADIKSTSQGRGKGTDEFSPPEKEHLMKMATHWADIEKAVAKIADTKPDNLWFIDDPKNETHRALVKYFNDRVFDADLALLARHNPHANMLAMLDMDVDHYITQLERKSPTAVLQGVYRALSPEPVQGVNSFKKLYDLCGNPTSVVPKKTKK